MANFTAIIPVANMQAANAALEQAGYGPDNFSVPAYANAGATHAALHSWHNPAFQTAVAAQVGAVVTTVNADPIVNTQTAITAQGAQWGDKAPSLPNTGNAVANTLYDYQGKKYWCIQTHDRGVYGGDPAQYPALIRFSHTPGKREPWVQPIDQYDAYKLVNPFTGLPDECTYSGKSWKVSQADGSGNNTYQPGVFGWVEIT